MAGWLEQVAWRLRLPEFRACRAYDDGRSIVVMDLEPDEGHEAWSRLRQLWLDLPPHPQLLDAIDAGDGNVLIVRYAAIAWRHLPLSLATSQARRIVATWGAQITDVLRMILAEVPAGDAGYFTRPRPLIDLVNDARLVFLPADVSASPRCDEQTMMFVIGGLIADLCTGLDQPAAEPIRRIVERCREPLASFRYRTLDDLHAAWSVLALASLDGERREAWRLAQEGIGWLELGRPRAALPAFVAALERNPRLAVAGEGRDRACTLLGEGPSSTEPDPAGSKAPTWSHWLGPGRQLEEVRAYADAIALYARVRLDGHNNVALFVARARCHLALGEADHTIDFARRALAIEPSNVAALALSTRGHLLARHFEDALQRAMVWNELDPADADAHHARGRALLGLGRLVDARDAFDRACSLRPRMLEAMLLRREVDRAMNRAAVQAGTQKTMSIDVPAHLAELRDALVTGRVHEALAVLEQPAYDTDPIAKLVQADCLAFDRRYADAIEIYERAASLAPEQRVKALLGKARALLWLDRGAEAVATLDALGELDDLELAELRGAALRRLGRGREADAELDRVVAAGERRSDLRLGRR